MGEEKKGERKIIPECVNKGRPKDKKLGNGGPLFHLTCPRKKKKKKRGKGNTFPKYRQKKERKEGLSFMDSHHLSRERGGERRGGNRRDYNFAPFASTGKPRLKKRGEGERGGVLCVLSLSTPSGG